MNVKDLMKELRKEPNKEKEVFVFFQDEIYSIQMVDRSISDRLDINICDVTNILGVEDKQSKTKLIEDEEWL